MCGGGDGPQPPRHQPHNCQQLISRQCGDSHSQPEDWKIQPCLCDTGGTDLILQVSHHTSTASLPMPSAWKQASALKGQPKFPCQFDVPNTFEEFKTRSCLTLNCKENTSKIYPEYPDKKWYPFQYAVAAVHVCSVCSETGDLIGSDSCSQPFSLHLFISSWSPRHSLHRAFSWWGPNSA